MKEENKNKIRNFSIIAHVDHGKSTLADRILEITSSISAREMEAQVLDNMDIERERGITIKARAVSLNYRAANGEEYIFNLIDTPGHVDFNYEVSRALMACEGAILVVDASQGIQAQTLANTFLAIENNLAIIPVLNKIDLPSADPERVCKEIEDILFVSTENAPRISAKSGLNVELVLKRIVESIPAPKGDKDASLKALIFDSVYDAYKGVIVYVRIVEGFVAPGMNIKMMATGTQFCVVEVGVMLPTKLNPTDVLVAGQVGYITASIKNVQDTSVGDTVTTAENPAAAPLPGYRKAVPMVFCGVYPADGSKYVDLKESLEKLQLNDASLSFSPETSNALGFGFRCGFLGLLHMEVIQERIEREYGIDLIITAPSVVYKLDLNDGSQIYVDNPTSYPNPSKIAQEHEPVINATILTPTQFMGSVMDLCQLRRGVYQNTVYIDTTRVELKYTLPLNEVIYDFFDILKSKTKGYASLDYELSGYLPSKLVKLDILLNGEVVDALSFVVHVDSAVPRGRRMVEKLKENISRQMFEIPIQAAIGGKVVARETLKALRKDVLAKCYGGDITRKKKLLEKQKEGKKRMRRLGSVEVSQQAFMSVLKLDD
ncbi:MAG: translation elongation factor 4 [Oscillospiraceae bacterium]|jgi:GTP-binding protein LepA|nr:translation elongation factor 4 [Oscillospiraceae bacterium]